MCVSVCARACTHMLFFGFNLYIYIYIYIYICVCVCVCVCMYNSAPLAKNMFLASPLAVTNANVLKWNERLQIAVDTANGLETV